ncbi:MAG: hypothetical protein H3C26_13735 [Rhodocyclaceae bacterium]|nr:hypothetical protein [Rhodocyclaceae bacterium]
MLTTAFSLFTLRQQPFERFTFPRWQSALAITLIGFLGGFGSIMRVGATEMPTMPLWLLIPVTVLSVWAVFLVTMGILRWWMKRSARWNGQGDLFNLLAASWLVANFLGIGTVALGVTPLLTLPLWLYAVWVGGNALSGAIPKASLGYSIAGIIIGLIPAMLTSGVIFALGGIVMAVLGVVPISESGAPLGVR